jgi:hypothetical protein
MSTTANPATSNVTHETDVPTWDFKERTPTASEKALLDDVLQLCRSFQIQSSVFSVPPLNLLHLWALFARLWTMKLETCSFFGDGTCLSNPS